MRSGTFTADEKLRREAHAWLPVADFKVRAKIFELLRDAAATGVDPIAMLRDQIQFWFGANADTILLAWKPCETPPAPGSIPMEPLQTPRRPTMWPQRPKRIAGELLSSWLWRTAIAANVPPRDFTRQVLGAVPHDLDRDIAPAADPAPRRA